MWSEEPRFGLSIDMVELSRKGIQSVASRSVPASYGLRVFALCTRYDDKEDESEGVNNCELIYFLYKVTKRLVAISDGQSSTR